MVFWQQYPLKDAINGFITLLCQRSLFGFLSNEIIEEYTEQVGEKFSSITADFVMSSLLTSANHLRYEPSYKWQLVEQDPDDNKFVDCAIGVNADYLVSDDRHIRNLLKVKDLFPPVPIVSFKEFKQILKLV